MVQHCNPIQVKEEYQDAEGTVAKEEAQAVTMVLRRAAELAAAAEPEATENRLIMDTAPTANASSRCRNMSTHSIHIIVTIALAIVAALFISYVIFLFAITPNSTAPIFQNSPETRVDELQTLQAMTPSPASSATVAKESKTLQAVSKTSAQTNSTSVSEQQKLDVISSMHSQ